MIIYIEKQPPLLADYGIEVPMLKGRAQKVYDELISKFGEKIIIKDPLPKITDLDFQRVHTKEYLNRCLQTPERVVEETFELINSDGSYNRYNPQNAKKPLGELVALYQDSCRGTYLAVQKAYQSGFAYYLGGGFHHALSNKGRGFCLVNDIMVAAKKFQAEEKDGLVWVIDIDVHKGCGTAEIAASDPSVKTLSIHMNDGWPLDSERLDDSGKLQPWFIPSDVDKGVPTGGEASYLKMLQDGLLELESLSNDKPSLCIVVDGSDPFEGDALPSANLLKLTKEQCLERNMLVYNFLRSRSIPQAYVMSGGYGDKNWEIHYQFLKKCAEQQS